MWNMERRRRHRNGRHGHTHTHTHILHTHFFTHTHLYTHTFHLPSHIHTHISPITHYHTLVITVITLLDVVLDYYLPVVFFCCSARICTGHQETNLDMMKEQDRGGNGWKEMEGPSANRQWWTIRRRGRRQAGGRIRRWRAERRRR